MAFSGYAQLWADKRVRTLFIAAFFARIPAMAAPLVFTLYVVDDLDGTYAQAGVVAAATTLGAAIGSPWRGRLIDRLGLRRAVAALDHRRRASSIPWRRRRRTPG